MARIIIPQLIFGKSQDNFPGKQNRQHDNTTLSSFHRTHRFQLLKSHLESIANQYGKTGTDRMWMAPLQEVYEYLVTRQTATFTSQLVGNRLDLTFDLRQIPTWLRRKTMTLTVNSTVDFNNVTVPAGIKMSFRGTGNQKIINLDFTDFKVGTNDLEGTPSVLKLFPNPVKNSLSVDCQTETIGKVRAIMYDISGKIMLQKDFDSPKFQLSTADLADGLYFLMVRQGKQIYRGKFVKNAQ